MIDRAIGLFGLALALIIGLYTFAPEGWPKLPSWATFAGIALGILLAGIGIGLVISDQRGHSEIAAAPKQPDLKMSIPGAIFFPPATKTFTINGPASL